MDFVLAFLLSFGPAFGCALLLYWLDRYEKEAMTLLGVVFFSGAFIAVAGAIAVQVLFEAVSSGGTGVDAATHVADSNLVAPLVTEALKGVAVLFVFLALRRHFDSLVNGAVYATVTALGFSATEGAFNLLGAASEKGLAGLVDHFLGRVLPRLWDAALYSAFFGMGLALARTSRSLMVRILAAPIGLALAAGLHVLVAQLSGPASESGPATSAFAWKGWVYFAFLLWGIFSHEKELVKRQLAEEVEAGRLTAQQSETAASAWKRFTVGKGTSYGSALSARRLCEVARQLAHAKELQSRLGEEGNRAEQIAELRGDLVSLSAQMAEDELASAAPS